MEGRRLTWPLRRMGVESLWQQGLSGRGVTIGHLDTGVDGLHPALSGRVEAFARCDGHVVDENAEIADGSLHGSHTAGLICGGEVEGWQIGVAPGARLRAAAVLDGGNNVVRALLGLDWLLKSEIRVLYLPLGIPGYNPVLSTMMEAARERGILPICPIGNGGPGQFHAPGIYPSVLSVGAVNAFRLVAAFSGRYQPERHQKNQATTCLKPEILAPGVNVVSAGPGNHPARRVESGTSQASALVAGVAALLFEARPDASAEQVEQALKAGCRTPHTLDEGSSRYGILDPRAALDALRNLPGGLGRPPSQVVFPHKWTDPTLRQACLCEPPGEAMDYIVVARPEHTPDERGAVGPILDRLQAKLGETVEQARFFPYARLAVLRSTRRFAWAMALDGAVFATSACKTC